MKVKLFIAALSITALCACSQYDSETETSVQTKKTIGFSIGDFSRADIRYKENVCRDGFKFSVIWDGGEAYGNATASWDESNNQFETSPQMFWPLASAEQPCVFHAVSYPGILETPISYKDGKNSFEYVVAKQVEEQQDVVVASVSAKEIPDRGILHMDFTHALTKVNFTVYVDRNEVNNNYVWRVSSVSLKAKDRGTYVFDAETPWRVSDTYADMQYLTSDQTVDVANGELWKGENNFMLIPQLGEDLTVTITWSVYLNIGKKLIPVSKKDASKSYKISTDDWKPGVSKRYSSLRLPNIGENTGSGDDGYDDNNMNNIGYNPECN